MGIDSRIGRNDPACGRHESHGPGPEPEGGLGSGQGDGKSRPRLGDGVPAVGRETGRQLTAVLLRAMIYHSVIHHAMSYLQKESA